jgi:ParB family chromosome partitioning protein
LGEGGVKRRDSIKDLYSTRPDPGKLAVANSHPAAESLPDERVLAGPVRTMGLALGRIEEESRALQNALAKGSSVVELDPSLIDGSFVRDRLGGEEAEFAAFRRSIEERGQEVPILVRPHPDKEGRYQVAYGHRRLRAVAELGRQVRAVVRGLTDAELVVAQGVENSARKDLTYIEKAVFAKRLEERGFDRVVIMDALSTDKGELSKLISVARSVPEEIIQVIGPAPKAGRRRWMAFAELLSEAKAARAALQATREPALAALDSDERFMRVLSAASPPSEPKVKPTSWTGERGRTSARISRSGTTVTLAIERDPAFGEFVAERLDELYAAFRGRECASPDIAPRRRGGAADES